MNKTLLATVIGGSILLAGCNKSIDSTSSSEVDSPIVSFSPSNGVVSSPNDLLMSSSGPTAGRLAEILGRDKETGELKDPTADVYAATATLDGWGLGAPFTIGIELPDAKIHQTEFDATSIEQDGVVYIFKCAEGTSVAAGGCANDPSTITPLTYGVDYTLTASDDGIVVTPLKPLEANTGYFLGVTNLVKDSFGQSVTRSATFEALSQGTGSGTDKELAMHGLISGTNNLLAALTGKEADSFMYSATWTTQDVESTAQAVMDKIVTDAGTITDLQPTGANVRYVLETIFKVKFDDSTEAGAKAAFVAENTIVWSGTLDLPYYLPFPGLDNKHPENEGAGNDITCNFSRLCGNWLNAQKQSPWKHLAAPVETVDPTSVAFDPVTAYLAPNTVDVLLLIPNATLMGQLGLSEVKIAQYVHGITSVKETAYAISPALASQGFAVVAIDQPLHGSRSFDKGDGGAYEITATAPSNGEQYANGNSGVFVNLASLLTARDNLRQATSDQLALRWAIGNTDLSAANGPNTTIDVSLLGVSLGSMVGTAAQGMSEIYKDESFKFTASVLFAGGAQVGPILGYSNEFGSTIKDELVGTTSFSGGVGPKLGYTQQEALMLQAATGDKYGKAAQEHLTKVTGSPITAATAQTMLGGTEAQANAEFGAMVTLGYSGFLRAFIDGAQTVLDSGDALIWSTKTTETPTLAIQIVGNGSTNLSDQTVPNDVMAKGYPLSGTAGWLKGLGLTQESGPTQGAALRVYTNFLVGTHSSALSAAHVEGVSASAEAAQAATTEMQTQIVTFLVTKGAVLSIADESVGTVVE